MTDKEKSGQNPDDNNPNPDDQNPAVKPGEENPVVTAVDDQDPDKSGEGNKDDDEDESKKTFSYDYVKKLREEAKSNRIKADNLSKEKKGLEEKVTQFEREKMTEDEKLKADLSKYEKELVPQKDKQIRSLQVQVQASKLGIVDPEAAEKLIDWDSIDATDSKAVEDALNTLVESKPWLKKTPEGKTPKVTTSTSTANPASSSTATKTFSRADLQKMTPEEINEAYEKGGLREAVAEGRVKSE